MTTVAVRLFLSTVPDADAAERWEALLPPEDLANAEQRRHPVARSERLAGRLLLRRALSTVSGENPFDADNIARWRFRREQGRLVGDPAQTPWRFSLSHGHGHAVCLLARGHACGVDLESADRALPWRALAGRYFHPDETLALARVPEDEQREAFLRLWTCKEATVKAWGTGLANHMARIVFDPVTLALRACPPEYAGDRLQLQHRRTGGLLLTAAVDAPVTADWRWETVDLLRQPG